MVSQSSKQSGSQTLTQQHHHYFLTQFCLCCLFIFFFCVCVCVCFLSVVDYNSNFPALSNLYTFNLLTSKRLGLVSFGEPQYLLYPDKIFLDGTGTVLTWSDSSESTSQGVWQYTVGEAYPNKISLGNDPGQINMKSCNILGGFINVTRIVCSL